MNGTFGINGITGYLVAVVLLLSILGGLSYLGIVTQQHSAVNPYVISGSKVADPKTKEDVWANLQEVKMISDDPADTQRRVINVK
ncbi:MAG: DUF4006 family protein [Helicobacteraceae bacterium]